MVLSLCHTIYILHHSFIHSNSRMFSLYSVAVITAKQEEQHLYSRCRHTILFIWGIIYFVY